MSGFFKGGEFRSSVWRLQIEGSIYTVHLCQTADEITVKVFVFGADANHSFTVLKRPLAYENLFSHRMSELPGMEADLSFQSGLWTLKVQGDKVNDWLDPIQNFGAPQDNELQRLSIQRHRSSPLE